MNGTYVQSCDLLSKFVTLQGHKQPFIASCGLSPCCDLLSKFVTLQGHKQRNTTGGGVPGGCDLLSKFVTLQGHKQLRISDIKSTLSCDLLSKFVTLQGHKQLNMGYRLTLKVLQRQDAEKNLLVMTIKNPLKGGFFDFYMCQKSSNC